MKPVLFPLLVLAIVPAFADEPGSWALEAWKTQVPPMRWLCQDRPVQSLLYEGEVYGGKRTEVFAFYASPVTLGREKPGGKYPGVILVHGGGGTAFAEWVWMWAQRGYAALAMDLSGSRPPEPVLGAESRAPVGHASDPKLRTRLENGGPGQGHPEKFDSIGGERSDDWPFHAAASVIRAHTLLRSFPEVDAAHTALTGISWGGYTTCLVASLDDRFQAAVPVYGCGFLHEGESVQRPSIDKLAGRAAQWVKDYDVGSLLPRCRVPIFFVNGTNDIHYPLDSYLKTYRAVPGEKQIRIEVKMSHGHPAGWAPQEIGLFIDSKCRGGTPLPIAGEPVVEGNGLQVVCQSATRLTRAVLHYTVDTGLRSGRKWESLPARLEGTVVTAPVPPAEATAWFVSVTDERGAMVTTAPVLAP